MLYNQIYLLNRDIFMYLFVYGTLISGESNHKTLGNSKLLGIAYTKGKLFDIGNYPALVPEGNNDIKGEVYKINEEILKQCDLLEGYSPNNPKSLYLRKTISINLNNKIINSYIYYSNFDLSKYCEIKSGDYVKNRKMK